MTPSTRTAVVTLVRLAFGALLAAQQPPPRPVLPVVPPNRGDLSIADLKVEIVDCTPPAAGSAFFCNSAGQSPWTPTGPFKSAAVFGAPCQFTAAGAPIDPYPAGISMTAVNRTTGQTAVRPFARPTWIPTSNGPGVSCLAIYVLKLQDSLPVDYRVTAAATDANHVRHSGSAEFHKP